MARRHKYGHLPLLSKTPVFFDRDYCSLPLSSRDNQVWWHPETNMVICPFCRRLQCFLTETTVVSLCHPETIRSDGMRRIIWSSAPSVEDSNVFRPRLLLSPFVIQRQSSPLEHRDKYGHLRPWSKTPMSFDRDCCSLPLSSRTIKSDSTQRKIWSFSLFVEGSNVFRSRLLQSGIFI